MLSQIPKVIPRVVLLVALLTTLVISSVPAFAGGNCKCHNGLFNPPRENRGCHFDTKTHQCLNFSCNGYCF